MLVLSRQVGQQVVIGNKIRVRVLKMSRSRVSLAIEAPANVPVDRGEVRLAKEREYRLTGDAERQPA